MCPQCTAELLAESSSTFSLAVMLTFDSLILTDKSLILEEISSLNKLFVWLRNFDQL